MGFWEECLEALEEAFLCPRAGKKTKHVFKIIAVFPVPVSLPNQYRAHVTQESVSLFYIKLACPSLQPQKL